jgi:hypothetical protein
MLSALHTLPIASRVCFGVLWLLTFPINQKSHNKAFNRTSRLTRRWASHNRTRLSPRVIALDPMRTVSPSRMFPMVHLSVVVYPFASQKCHMVTPRNTYPSASMRHLLSSVAFGYFCACLVLGNALSRVAASVCAAAVRSLAGWQPANIYVNRTLRLHGFGGHLSFSCCITRQ